MEDLICPKCGQKHFRIHSILVPKKDETDVEYEWECAWCNYREGNYTSTTEAKQEYQRKYGGNSNG